MRSAVEGRKFLDPALFSSSRFAFVFLFAYLLSQVFLIPVAAVGPVWALWPTLPDLAFGGLLLVALRGLASSAASQAQKALLLSLLLIDGLCLASYVVTLFVAEPPVSAKALTLVDGAYDLFRLAQFTVLYALVIRIPLNERRLRLLGFAVDIAFVGVCASIFFTYFGIVRLGTLTAHLPQDPGVCGNWYEYAFRDKLQGTSKGLGTVSYSHSYVAIQVLMLLALRLHLLGGRRNPLAAAYVLLAVATALLSESRAGLAAMVLFAAVYSLSNPKILVGGLIMVMLAVPAVDWRRIEGTLRRQQTIVEATEGDNLSSRPRIWINHLNSLTKQPLHVLVGGGFGSARVGGLGSNAHMLYLHILTECGAIGLFLFSALFALVVRALYRHDIRQKPLFWAAIALLLSAVTQETFYPTPSQGHFIGLFLAAIAIGLRAAIPDPGIAGVLPKGRAGS